MTDAHGGAGPAADARDRVLQTLLSESQYGLLLLDERLRIAWVSDAGAAALHHAPADMVGTRAGDYLDSAQTPGALAAIEEVLGGTVEQEPGWQLGVRVGIICGDGQTREFEFGGRPLHDAGPSGMMLLFVDVSERARLEDVLTAVTEHNIELALQRFMHLAAAQLRADLGVALRPSLGGATYLSAGARRDLLHDLSVARTDATVRAVTSPLGSLFGWFVVDRDHLGAWAAETTDRLVALLGVILSNQARFSDLVTAAATDPLTGLSNRRVLEVSLVAAESTASEGWAVLYCDLDGFKAINDRWGHDVGDHVLRVVGERLRQVVRSGDVIARLGGDEFVILAQADPDQAELLAQRVREEMALPVEGEGGCLELGVSVGVATATTPGGVPRLLAEADAAMRQDKESRSAAR